MATWTYLRHRGLWLGLALVLPCHFGSASAQAVLELDLAGGRRIVDGPELSFRNFGAVDYERRLVYAVEALEPLAVAAYAMDDGSVVRLYGAREGEGPGELLRLEGVALSEEGVFLAGRGVVNHWGFSGELIYQWRPVAPGVGTICSMGGQPAVAGQLGVVVRVDDGRSLALGGDSLSTAIRRRTAADGGYARWTYMEARAACVDSVEAALGQSLDCAGSADLYLVLDGNLYFITTCDLDDTRVSTRQTPDGGTTTSVVCVYCGIEFSAVPS